MILKNLSKTEIKSCFENVDKYLKPKEIKWIKFLDLGCKVIRIISYSEEILALIQKQLTFVLKDSMPNFDAQLIIWEETNIFDLAKNLSHQFNPKTNLQLRIKMLVGKLNQIDFSIIDSEFSVNKPIIDIQSQRGFFIGNDFRKKTYYYGIKNLNPEDFIKEGHIFVQFLNNIIKDAQTNLVHGAVIGTNNTGVLICARGQRGKSTLSVLSMIKGFEYVSDDYLILEKLKDNLYAYPIYSIITLSPRMYNELYYELGNAKFVSNNARKDKYVINISNFHEKFRTKYPIKFCLFPEIVSNPEPSIQVCSKSEKGRAITHLIHSTIFQMQDQHDIKTINKLIHMLKDFKFYKINLCNDINKNTELLRNFCQNIEKKEIIKCQTMY